MLRRESFFLVDLPTYPKGTIALSLYAVAAALGDRYLIRVFDLNFHPLEEIFSHKAPALIGLKVSAQNFHLAVEVTDKLKEHFPDTPVMWGGEYPTLQPEACAGHADLIVEGAVEPVAKSLVGDLEEGKLQAHYKGGAQSLLKDLRPPRLDLLRWEAESLRFMGLPMETSRGCTYKCTFCLVHHMQPKYLLKDLSQLKRELPLYAGRFINLVDYNFGVDPAHVIRTAHAIRDSEALGWMAEMCLESLDNEELLEALAESRCRMIYCGLESVDEQALQAVNKARTNQIANYERIIKKVQAHGIQIAAGVIIGLPESAHRKAGAMPSAIESTRKFFQRMGVIYAKLTFITYNPGTKVRESMRRKGVYQNEAPGQQDGNHISFLAHGLSPDRIYREAESFILRFYHPISILRRVLRSTPHFWARAEYFLFNLCYRDVYHSWLERGIFHDEDAFQHLLRSPLQKRGLLKLADRLLNWVRRRRYRMETGRKASANTAIPRPSSTLPAPHTVSILEPAPLSPLPLLHE